jgi:hypothetical protein
LPGVNLLAVMALAIIAVVQAVELYGDETDRLSYFRDAARARNHLFMFTLFIAKQVSALSTRVCCV